MHLFERDCSLQRRHQKVIEEAPAPGMDAATREAVCAAAVRAAKAVGYEGAGTVEFIADASDGLRADRIWFMEMNTRLQVEHPVTEAITGQDLVEWQLRVASGEPLPLRQDQLAISGHAMEARLYAENPATGFLPSTGVLEHLRLPTDVRVDSAVEEGSEVTPFYDPMIAKLIAHAPTREAAAAKLAQACREVEVWPVKTNAAFLARCLAEPDFVAGRVDTGFIGARLEVLVKAAPVFDAAVAGAAVLASQSMWRSSDLWRSTDRPSPLSPWDPHGSGLFGFHLNSAAGASFRFSVDGTVINALVRTSDHSHFDIEVDGCSEAATLGLPVRLSGRPFGVQLPHRPKGIPYHSDPDGVVFFLDGAAAYVSPIVAGERADESASDGAITSPMPGRIVAVQVARGDKVAKGAALLTLEAMKMEHVLTAPFDGVVAELDAEAGGQVPEGVVLVKLEAVERS